MSLDTLNNPNLPYLKLDCKVQNYAWGKKGKDSLVARVAVPSLPLSETVDDNVKKTSEDQIDETKPYAELWMGTHRNAPSGVASTNTLLLDHLKARPDFWLGQQKDSEKSDSDSESQQYFYSTISDIPFLFKILSVNQALSIQAHPHKSLAEQLNREQPKTYDDNHKPEIAIPLTDFEALCGFRKIEEIKKYCGLSSNSESESGTIPELKELLIQVSPINIKSESVSSESAEANLLKQYPDIKTIYSSLMRANPILVEQQVKKLVDRLTNLKTSNDADFLSNQDLFDLVLRLSQSYPGDIGIFSVFFLNYVKIEVNKLNNVDNLNIINKFIFCAPNVPHAYLYGDCIECMAQSDNVVRAGLTPKFKDVELLLNMLDYRDDILQDLVKPGIRIRNESGQNNEDSKSDQTKVSNWILYSPPKEIPDFVVYEYYQSEFGKPLTESEFQSDPLVLKKASIVLILELNRNSTVELLSVEAEAADSSCLKILSVDDNESTAIKVTKTGEIFFVKAGVKLYIGKGIGRVFVATWQ